MCILMDMDVQVASQVKREMLLIGLTSDDEDRNYSREATDVTLPRKASSELITTRTANRHR